VDGVGHAPQFVAVALRREDRDDAAAGAHPADGPDGGAEVAVRRDDQGVVEPVQRGVFNQRDGEADVCLLSYVIHRARGVPRERYTRIEPRQW
jgi:hypothetical protein